jgi:serine/threonine protein kinase
MDHVGAMVPTRVAKPTHSMMGADAPPGGDDDTDLDDRTVRPAERVFAGSILGGKYKLISEIGRGGMGSVWRAQHLGWEAPVALKIMNRDITSRPEALARFEREVRLAAGLRSPHVVQVLDHGVDEATRTPYIAMELLEGESLARRLKNAGRISPTETFHVFSELVRALTRAHAAGIVHRDLKPDNVFLVRNEDESLTKVLDFGVAKWTAPDISESGLTRPGSVVGTPYYMSPEQIQGSREIDHRADLWALAAIACECLTGRRPFEAPDFAQLAVMLLGNSRRPLPSSLGPVPPGFDAWFSRATDPDIARRFQTAREMAQALAPVCDATAPSSGSGSDAYPAPRQSLSSSSLSGSSPSTWHDPPSMAPVSNTASVLLFSPRLWERPMVKLVATTVATTLLVTGALAFWLFGKGPQAGTTSTPTTLVTSTPTLLPTNTPPTNSGPGGSVQTGAGHANGGSGTGTSQGPNVRPISDDAEPTAPPPNPDAPASFGRTPSDSPLRGFDTDDDLRRRVRAAQLGRLERDRLKLPKRSKPNAARSTPEQSEPTATQPRATPDPLPSHPESQPDIDAPPEPKRNDSNVVDGRHIRTTL